MDNTDNLVLLKSKSELYDLLPQEYQDKGHLAHLKKVFGKIFSIGANNRWKCYYAVPRMVIEFIYEDDYVKCSGVVNLRQTNFVSEVSMNKLTFKQSGLSIQLWNRGYLCLLTSDNNVFEIGYNNYMSLVGFCQAHKRSDIVKTGNSFNHVASEVIDRNPDCFRRLEWHEFFSYTGVLCKKDCGLFKKGMIIDRYSQYFDSKYFLRIPIDLVGNGRYGGLHQISASIACDLNTVELEVLESIGTQSFFCSRGKYGCHNGCVNLCYAENANNRDKITKQILIKLWKECFGEKADK